MPGRKSSPASRRAGKSKHSSRNAKRLNRISGSTSQIVKQAAALLDEEVAAGVVAARKMQQRFRKERRVDPADFKEALQKFQGDAHEVVHLLNGQVDEMRSGENSALVKRLLSHSHDILDLAVEFVNTGSELASQLAQSTKKQPAADRAKRSR